MSKDTIYRQDAIDALEEERCTCESDYDEGYLSMLDKAIWIVQEWLPSAQTERKKGEWVKVNGKTAINCSACYHCSWSLSFEDTVKRFNFCPNCGADMRGES